jgi:hypothetical protein
MSVVKVDFSRIQQIAMSGVRRTALFLGLGISAANHPALKEYQLWQESPLQFLPPKIDEETLANFKHEFSSWVVACGFRELIETFCVFLDGIYAACLVMSANKAPMTVKDYEKRVKRFRYLGLDRKISELKAGFDVATSKSEHIVTIGRARNCLTHRLGIVGDDDCSDGEELMVSWVGLDVYAEDPSGKTTPLHPMPPGGVLLAAGGSVKAKYSDRLRTFRKGTRITFTPNELFEICLSVSDSTGEVTKSAQAYSKKMGG